MPRKEKAKRRQRRGRQVTNFAPQQLNPRQLFYPKLAKALANDGFRLDPRLLRKSDASKSVEKVLGVADSMGAAILGPLGALVAPLVRPLIDWAAWDGEDIYGMLKDVAPLFDLIAVKYKSTAIVFCAVIEADRLNRSKAEAKACALCAALWKLARKLNTDLHANCLYVFFDDRHYRRMSSFILAKGYKAKASPLLGDAYVDIWPIVMNVPAERFEGRKRFGDAYKRKPPGGKWVVSKGALYDALVSLPRDLDGRNS